MVKRIARTVAVASIVAVSALAGLPSVAEAHDVVLRPDVHQVLQRTTNVEQAYKVEHCIIHFEFGTFGGTAYSFVRVTHEDRGYICTYTTQVVGVREGDEVINSPQSQFNCAARTPRPCNPPANYYRWARSTLPNATIYAANIQVNVNRGWPPPDVLQRNYATISSG